MASPDPIVAPGTEAPAAESQSGEVGSVRSELRSHARVEPMYQTLPRARVKLMRQVLQRPRHKLKHRALQCALVEPTVQVR